MRELLRLDSRLFLLINKEGQNGFFDAVMPFVRQPFTWLPVYLFFLVFALLNIRRTGWLWVLAVACTAAITDLISSSIIKPFFQRPRPCRAADIMEQVHLLANCGGNGSFTSSHASNHFGMAMFIFLTLHPYIGRWGYLLFAWAALICYAQVYVGVHYPGDVLGGALLGCMVGGTMAWLYNRYFPPELNLTAAVRHGVR